MQVSIVVARALAWELARRDIDEELLFDHLGLDLSMLEDPMARLSFDEWNAVVEKALRLTSDPQLGLFVGANMARTPLSVLGPLITSCGTLREAATHLFRYAPLVVEGVRWELEVRDDVASLSCELPAELVYRAYEHEACLSLAYTVMRIFGRNEAPLEVCFAHESTGPLDVYQRIFDCEVRFGARENVIRGRADVLDRRQLHTDPTLGEMLRTRAERLLSELRLRDSLPVRVRRYLEVHQSPIRLDAASLAEEFGLSERTFRRRLTAHGTNVRELLDTTLREMACSALEDPTASIKEVSFRLGFSHLSAFYRAFRRWTGVTPAEYRAGLGGS